jgi:hypothetical protein
LQNNGNRYSNSEIKIEKRNENDSESDIITNSSIISTNSIVNLNSTRFSLKECNVIESELLNREVILSKTKTANMSCELKEISKYYWFSI